MIRFASAALAACAAFAVVGPAAAQTVDTRTLAPGAAPATAGVDVLKGIVGEWTKATGAAGFSAPVAGEIVGHLIDTDDKGAPRVQELWIFKSEGGSVVLRQKIFGGDLSEREDKDKFETRKLVAVQGGKFYFENMTIIPKGDSLEFQLSRGAAAPLDDVFKRAK
jgi:hypothetical protein